MILPPAFSKEKNCINAVIETPRGSRNKYDYDHEYDFFRLKKVLPAGTSFPLDFGFIPHTRGEDGDPLDVLVIMDFTAVTGCVVECKVIGIIEAEQKEKKKKAVRNDRIIAVASESISYSDLKNMDDLNPQLLDDIIHFFEYYNEMEEKKFKVLKTKNAHAAINTIQKNITP
jgi:inorganic pyrophosphatase